MPWSGAFPFACAGLSGLALPPPGPPLRRGPSTCCERSGVLSSAIGHSPGSVSGGVARAVTAWFESGSGSDDSQQANCSIHARCVRWLLGCW
jgi:hypothetical protein